MHRQTDRTIDRDIYLLSQEDFEAYYSDILRDDPEASHSLAEMMLRFMDATAEGPPRSNSALNAYQQGIEILYLDTPAHNMSFDLYLAWLRGRLKPQDEPMTLIDGALGRQTVPAAERQFTAPEAGQPHQRPARKEKKAGSRKKKAVIPKEKNSTGEKSTMGSTSNEH